MCSVLLIPIQNTKQKKSYLTCGLSNVLSTFDSNTKHMFGFYSLYCESNGTKIDSFRPCLTDPRFRPCPPFCRRKRGSEHKSKMAETFRPSCKINKYTDRKLVISATITVQEISKFRGFFAIKEAAFFRFN